MINCNKCGESVEKIFSHEKVCVPKKNPLQELDDRINEHREKHGEVEVVYGAFGNNRIPAYVEEKIKTERGLRTKFIGCSYSYPVQVEYVDEVAITKAAYMGVMRLALQNPLILLRPKKLIQFLSRIYSVDLAKKVSYIQSEGRRRIKYDELTPLCRAIVDVGNKIAQRYKLKYPLLEDEFGTYLDQREFRQDVINVFEALASFIQRDGGYYFIVLDFFSNMKEKPLSKNPLSNGFNEAFNLVIERDRTTLKSKVRLVKLFFFLARFTPLRMVIKEFEKIRIEPDEDEIYFAHRKELYDFGGLPWSLRKELVRRSDKNSLICSYEL